MRSRLFNHLQRLPFSYFDENTDADGQVANTKIAINASNTIYTDVNGIAMVDLPKASYTKISISKTGYTAQSNVSVTVDNAPIYKAITLVKAS